MMGINCGKLMTAMANDCTDLPLNITESKHCLVNFQKKQRLYRSMKCNLDYRSAGNI